MKASDFSSDSWGRLVRVAGGYEAFVPLDAGSGPLVRALGEAVGPRAGAQPVVALAQGAFVVAHDGAVPGRVRAVTFRRGRSELAVEVIGAGLLTAVAAGGTWRPGDVVRLALDPQRVALLRAATPE